MSTTQARSSLASRGGFVAGRPAWRAVRGWLGRGLDLLLVWHARAGQRRRLQVLTERDLRDLGLSRADVEREVSRRFWQP